MRLLLAPIALMVGALFGLPSAASAQPTPPLTYVAIGASDAVGVGASDPATNGWVPLFASKLGPSVRLVNLGVSGSTLNQALDEQIAPAVDAQPDVVTVWLAVNDFNARVPLDSYAADLDTLLTQLQTTTHARVLVGNIPDLSAVAVYQGVDPAGLDAAVDSWNQVIAETTARHGDTLVDLYARWQEIQQHPEYVSTDGFHPSDAGYQALADVFAGAM
jgi:lysophospholipase L1-like esterase